VLFVEAPSFLLRAVRALTALWLTMTPSRITRLRSCRRRCPARGLTDQMVIARSFIFLNPCVSGIGPLVGRSARLALSPERRAMATQLRWPRARA